MNSNDDNDDYNDDIHLDNMSVNFSPDHPVSYFPELFAVNLFITLMTVILMIWIIFMIILKIRVALIYVLLC